jgi:hypothetical protein
LFLSEVHQKVLKSRQLLLNFCSKIDRIIYNTRWDRIVYECCIPPYLEELSLPHNEN